MSFKDIAVLAHSSVTRAEVGFDAVFFFDGFKVIHNNGFGDKSRLVHVVYPFTATIAVGVFVYG